MVTRQTKRGGFSTASQERVEQTAQQAGIADGLGQFAKLAPQVFALQQSLLAGIAQSQQREAKRLASLYADDDPRIARAIERASQVEQLHAQAQAQAAVVGHAVQTFQQDGLFHGYVHQPDGAPAVGYTVEVLMRSDKEAQSAKTDEEGYFRIDLRGDIDTGAQGSGASRWAELNRWAERFAQMAKAERYAAEPSETTANSSAAATQTSGEGTAASSAQVFDPKGRLVFEDPAPPTFEEASSQFRYYVLRQGGAPAGHRR
jgi:hypothetical protein